MAGDHDERIPSQDKIQTVTMPKWGLSMTTGKIVEWFVAEGDILGKGDDVVDIDTDKIAGTLESPVAGPVRRLVAEVGDQLPIGAVLVVVAPEEVPDSEIDAVVAEAKEAAASGALDVPEEPQPQFVEIGGRTISYLTLAAEEPSGDPVVLVHGFGGDKNSWLFVQQPLAEEHAVHALDLPGHGASDKEVGDGSLADLAGIVVGFLDVRTRKSCERAWQIAGVDSSRADAGDCLEWGQPGARGGVAQARRSSGLAVQGRYRSRAGPVRGFPPLRPHSSR